MDRLINVLGFTALKVVNKLTGILESKHWQQNILRLISWFTRISEVEEVDAIESGLSKIHGWIVLDQRF